MASGEWQAKKREPHTPVMLDEVLEWLRTHPDCGSIPTVVVSGSGLQPDIQQAYKLGANSYFIKPSNLGELRELLRSVIDYWSRSARPLIRADC